MAFALATTLFAIFSTAADASPAAAFPSPSACLSAISHAVANGSPGGVDPACYRSGPLAMGMRELDVEQRLGPPVATGDVQSTAGASTRNYRVALYAFPASPPSPVKHGRADMRLVELLYDDGRLAKIDNGPGARIGGPNCNVAGRPQPQPDVAVSAPVGPFRSFAGVSVGSRLTSVAHRFGRTPNGNRSQDWYSYLPIPISFGVDPDTRTVTSFAVATDQDALTTFAWPILRLERDPRSCRLTVIHFDVQSR